MKRRGLNFMAHELPTLLSSMERAKETAPPGNFMSTWWEKVYTKLRARVEANNGNQERENNLRSHRRRQ